MIQFIVMGGPYALLLCVLALVVIGLTVKKGVDLFARTDLERNRLAGGLNAILFWGCFSAVLGILGQFHATYLSLTIIRQAEMINPALVAEGMAVSLISTLMGLGILAIAGLAWFGLRSRLNSLTAREQSPSPA